MRTDYLRLAPDLELFVTWSPRMNNIFQKRYPLAQYRHAEVSEQRQREYDQWERAQEAAFAQIQRFFTLTNSLPVAGDRLLQGGKRGGEVLRIEKRMIFSMPDSDSHLLIYEVCSDEIEELEIHQEGDLVEEEEVY